MGSRDQPPLGFPRDATPQGQFYCSVGAENAYGREVIETHLDMCLEAGINVEGINAEVAVGSGSSRFSRKVRKTQETRYGSLGTLPRGTQRSTAYL